MDIEQAFRIINRQAPCPHHNINTNIGDGSTWAKCDDCGATILQESLAKAQESADNFDNAIAFLHRVIEESK